MYLIKMYKTPIVIAIHQIRITLLCHLTNCRKAEVSGNKQVYWGVNPTKIKNAFLSQIPTFQVLVLLLWEETG